MATKVLEGLNPIESGKRFELYPGGKRFPQRRLNPIESGKRFEQLVYMAHLNVVS